MKKNIFLNFYHDSHKDCRNSIIKLATRHPKAQYLDCGCDDGSFTKQVANKIGTKNIFGIEIGKSAASKARKNGIQVKDSDLNKSFPFPDNSLDIVTANQVIEHLYDTDNFVREIFRVLKPNGYAVISTNNLASWHNLFSLLFGYQPFPSDISTANPGLGKLIPIFEGDADSWAHLRIFTYKSLPKIMQHHGFVVEKIVGVGYYPLPSSIANFIAEIDKRHSAYLTLRIRKPR